MTRRTFAQTMNETFLTGDVPGTTATTASTEPAPSLTLDTLLKLRRKYCLIIYYIPSLNVDDVTAIYKVPNDFARVGYDLVLHPSLVPELLEMSTGYVRICPLDDAEIDRRSAALAAQMAYRQSIYAVNKLLDDGTLSPLSIGARSPFISLCGS